MNKEEQATPKKNPGGRPPFPEGVRGRPVSFFLHPRQIAAIEAVADTMPGGRDKSRSRAIRLMLDIAADQIAKEPITPEVA